VPDRALVEERTQHLYDEQRVPARLPVEERQQLAPHVLPVERGLGPLLEPFARQAGEGDLPNERAAGQTLPPPERFPVRLLRPERQTDHHPLGVELGHEGLERVPGGSVRPLHVVEHDDEGARRGGAPQVLGNLVEQHEAAASARLAVGLDAHDGRQARQLAPRPRGRTVDALERGHDLRPRRVR